MTEIEFLHEMVKAAGGDPNMLKDKLKSTYYECIINCLNNGGGSGSGSTGGGNDKVIVGEEVGETITFSKPASEIYELGSDLLKEYDLTLVITSTLYRACYTHGKSTTADGRTWLNVIFASFYNVSGDEIQYLTVKFYKDGAIERGIVSSVRLPNLPTPNNAVVGTNSGDTVKLLASVNGNYTLINYDKTANNPTLVAVEQNGALFPVITGTLAEISADMFAKTNGSLNLIVMQDMISETAANTYLVYHLARMENMSDASNMRAIFSNGIDKNIEMNAAGNFFYID